MKQLLILTAIACLGYSCSKSSNPNPSNNGTGSNTGTGTETGTQTTLKIDSFSPKAGKPGTTITISGKDFGSDPSVVQVAIGTSAYDHPISVTPTSFTIQTNLATPSGKVSIIVNGTKITSSDDFTALPPDLSVVGFNSAVYQLGHFITISGNGFGLDTNKIMISFGGTKPVHANGIFDFGLQISTLVPRYAQEGPISVTLNGQSGTSPQSVKFSMSLRDYTPKTFHAGDTVTVTGVAFTNTNDMSIDFNNNKVTRPIKVTPTQLQVIVPADAVSGYLRVSAALGTIEDLTLDRYTVIK